MASKSIASDTSSVTDPLDNRDDDGWEDVEKDEEPISFVSLFDTQVFPDAKSMLSYCRDKYGFDIWKMKDSFGLEFMDLLKLVNYVRLSVKSGNLNPDVSSTACFEDDQYLKPVLEDDALLYSLDDVFEENEKSSSKNEVEELREQLASLQNQFAAYREQVQDALLSRLDDSEPGSSVKGKEGDQPTPNVKDRSAEQDSDYFKSYSYNTIHDIMLKDRIRTDAYRNFMYDNKHLFAGKTVLDVGCGTGILSMFCAKAGAKLVLAVDNSDIINKARENVFTNGLQDTVKCIRGKMEEVTLPVQKVDIIVSEWMGYCLLYESMLDSVIYARDRYLADDGLMVPSHTTLRIAPLADSELKASHIDFWRDVYGFDMTSMLERAEEEVIIRVLDKKELAGDSVPFLKLDLHKATVADLSFKKPFTVTWNEGFKLLEGFVVWFDIFFGLSQSQSAAEILREDISLEDAAKTGTVAFSTGPYTEATHWQQGIFLIKNPTQNLVAGEKVTGEITYVKKEGQERSLDIDMTWKCGQSSESKSQIWVMD